MDKRNGQMGAEQRRKKPKENHDTKPTDERYNMIRKLKEQVQQDNDASSMYLFYWNIYMYLGSDSFPDDFGQFPRFFLNANGRTYRPTDIRTYERTDRPSYRDARTHLKT